MYFFPWLNKRQLLRKFFSKKSTKWLQKHACSMTIGGKGLWITWTPVPPQWHCLWHAQFTNKTCNNAGGQGQLYWFFQKKKGPTVLIQNREGSVVCISISVFLLQEQTQMKIIIQLDEESTCHPSQPSLRCSVHQMLLCSVWLRVNGTEQTTTLNWNTSAGSLEKIQQR